VNITYRITSVLGADVGWNNIQCKFYVNDVSPVGGYFGMDDVDNNNLVSSGDIISITELRVGIDVNTGDPLKLELTYLPTNEIAGSLTISAPYKHTFFLFSNFAVFLFIRWRDCF
jgi:hypothetical protein